MITYGPLQTNSREICIKVQTFLSKKIWFKILSTKCLSFCSDLNVLMHMDESITSVYICTYSVSPIYRGRVYRGIGYIAVACWTPFFWRPRARYFSRNRGNSLDPIRGRQFFAKSAHRDSLCSRFAGDNFSRNQLKPTCQCGLEHMLCDGQPR